MRAFPLAVAAVGLGLAAAGCGAVETTSVASLAPAPPATTQATTAAPGGRPDRAALASCFTTHGFPAAVGSAAGAGAATLDIAGVLIEGKVDPNEPQFQRALQACRKYLPGGGPPALTPAQQAVHARAMARFAACMRTHGVPGFPDPNAQGTFPLAAIRRLDPRSPAFQSAFKACESLEPRLGPRIDFG